MVSDNTKSVSLGKLRPEFKARWVAALRSGQYKQGVHRLHHKLTETYCCLGVACMITGKPTHTKSGAPRNLPTKRDVQTWWAERPTIEADLTNPCVVLANGRIEGLATLNDNFGLSFNEIADLIDQQL